MWCKKLICSCGAGFRKQKWHKTDNGEQCGYICSNRLNHGSTDTRSKKGLDTSECCDTKQIADYKLNLMAEYLLKSLRLDRESIINIATDILKNCLHCQNETYDYSRLSDLENEVKKNKKKLSKLIDTWLEVDMEPEIFTQKKNEISSAIEVLNSKIAEIEKPVEIVNVNDRMEVLKSLLNKMIICENANESKSIIDAVVEKVVVDNTCFRWYLRNGGNILKLNVKGSRKNPKLTMFDSDTTGSS